MNNIYCKSGIDIKQLEARSNLDTNGIELQLLSDFIDKPKTTREYIDNIKEYIKDIKVIHVPLKLGEEVVEVQMLSEDTQQKLFNRICELAQTISNINNQETTIVIHNSWSLREYEYSSDKYNKIINYLKEVLNSNKNIKIAIENVVPFSPTGSGDFRNGVYPDYIDFIKKIRDEINSNRIGSVLDTCHAMVSIEINNLIRNYGEYGEEITIEDYYKVNENICMLVHLCNVEKLGYNKGQHGIYFDRKDKELLRRLLQLHKRYIPNTDITLEVQEDDYTNCKNYSRTKELFDEIINEGI